MKGKKCFGLLLVLFTTLLSLSSVYSDANAIDFDETGTASITACSMLFNNQLISGTVASNGCSFISNNTGTSGWSARLIADLSISIPGKSFVIISGRYLNNQNAAWQGLGSYNNLTPITNSVVFNTANANNPQVSFMYVYYTATPLTSIRLENGQQFWWNIAGSRLDLQNIAFVTLTNEPTRQQIQSIINYVSGLSSDLSDINQNTADILQYLQDKEDQEQDDRDNIEQQSSDNQDSADDAGNEADQAGQTLLQAFGSLITALTSVHETSCTLPNMSVYSLNLNNIDLCAVSLPSGVAALVSIGMVLIIVPLGIHLVKKMISLYKEITG